jgi:hypothetical protein
MQVKLSVTIRQVSGLRTNDDDSQVRAEGPALFRYAPPNIPAS